MRDDTISRAATIDALEKVAELFPWRVPGNRDSYDRYNEAWNDSIGRAEIEIEKLPSAQRWVPCEERLPEPGVNVLVDVLDIPADDRFPLVDKIGDDGGWCNCYGEWFAVAWMPIPDPYKEGEK